MAGWPGVGASWLTPRMDATSPPPEATPPSGNALGSTDSTDLTDRVAGGTSDESAAVPERIPLPSVEPDWDAPPRWVSVRDRSVVQWVVLFGGSSVLAGVAWWALGSGAAAGGWPVLLTLAWVMALGGSALAGVMAFATPAFWARQGMLVDARAVTLVSERLWWSPGRRARIPWKAIRSVRTRTSEVHGRVWMVLHGPWGWRRRVTWHLLRRGEAGKEYFVVFRLRHSVTRYRLPSWAHVSVRALLRYRRRRGKPPTRFDVNTTRVGQRRLMTTLWTVRPDYFFTEDGRRKR